MSSRIIDREITSLNSSQTKMIISGWGEEVFENSIVERITYLSDGLKVKGYIAYPKEGAGKFPCIIWNRGGMKENGAIDSFTARGVFGQLASWGYAVFASQYRGNAGGEGKEHFGGDDVNDILNLIPLSQEIPQADFTKWGIEGWSRGGMMTYLVLARNRNFKCAILSGAISNLKQNSEENPEMKGKYKRIISEEDFEQELEKRSAVNFVERLPSIPYLLLHGGSDTTVSPIQTIEMSKRFSALKIPFRLVIFEGGDHFLKSYRKEVDEVRKSWFNKYLK